MRITRINGQCLVWFFRGILDEPGLFGKQATQPYPQPQIVDPAELVHAQPVPRRAPLAPRPILLGCRGLPASRDAMPDALRRQWLLLRHIPRHPQRRTAAELRQYLASEGYPVDLRSVQRDLNDLSAIWGFTNDQEGRKHYWYWPDGFAVLDVPGLSPGQALVLHMARHYLGRALPQSQLTQLDPYFTQAERVLTSQGQPLARWRNRVRIISRGPALAVPDVLPDVLDTVQQALLRNRVLHLRYRRRGETQARDYEASLHALVLKDGVIYGVVTFRSYTNLSHIALHRIREAQLLERPATRLPDFDLDAYLSQQEGFAYPGPETARIKLRLRLSPAVAEHLAERPLSADQTLKPTADGQVEARASVLDTQELRWWLLGFGAAVEVLGPALLRRAFRDIAGRLHQRYTT